MRLQSAMFYPYNNVNTMINLLYRFNNRPKLIAISGNRNDGKDYIADYIARTYLYKRIDFKDPLENMIKKNKYLLTSYLISRIDNNKYYVIGDLEEYNQYIELLKFNPFIIKVHDNNIKDIDDNIPYHIYLTNQKDKHKLIKQLKYEFIL